MLAAFLAVAEGYLVAAESHKILIPSEEAVAKIPRMARDRKIGLLLVSLPGFASRSKAGSSPA